MEAAKRRIITHEMNSVAKQEGVSPKFIQQGIASGKVILLYDTTGRFNPVGIGPGLRIKINANIGTSCDYCDPEMEIQKAKEAEKWGADTLMDLSAYGDIRKIRTQIIKSVRVPVGVVPVYQAASEAIHCAGTHLSMKEHNFFEVVIESIRDGCTMLTVHCSVNKGILHKLSRSNRIIKITSKGGGIIASWMKANDAENPFFRRFDDLLDIARRHDTILSFGAAFRSGCVSDGADSIHKEELATLGKLVKRARKAGVQIKVEGPGHLAAHQIGPFIRKAKKLCKGAPLGVLGPIVTDIAPGYDYITFAIGATLAILHGADYLCTVYPSEHLGLPILEDIPLGIIAARIAAHAGDLAHGSSNIAWDNRMARARASLDWASQLKEAIDPYLAKSIRERIPTKGAGCSVCGHLCPHKLFGEV